ncbi:MAG: class I SAM-dependent methyltransferase [Candidatus Parvarchaeum sp.]
MQSLQGFFSRHAKEYASSESHMHGKDLDLLISMLDLKKSYKVLDVGTGPGFVAFEISGKVAISLGLDINEHMLEIAVRKAENEDYNNVIFVRGDALSMPFPDNVFDAVTCRRVAHHIKEKRKFIEEVWRVLKKGGKFGITDLLKPTGDKKDIFNKFEKARDTSYISSESLDYWFKLLKENAFEVDNFKTFETKETFQSWLSPVSENSIEGRKAKKILNDNIDYFKEVFEYDPESGYFNKSRMVIIAKKPE